MVIHYMKSNKVFSALVYACDTMIMLFCPLPYFIPMVEHKFELKNILCLSSAWWKETFWVQLQYRNPSYVSKVSRHYSSLHCFTGNRLNCGTFREYGKLKNLNTHGTCLALKGLVAILEHQFQRLRVIQACNMEIMEEVNIFPKEKLQ